VSGPVGVPVGEEQFRVRGNGVYDFAAKYAMLAVFRFEIMIGAKGASGNGRGQGFAEMQPITAKARVEHGDLQPFASIPRPMPGRDAEMIEDLAARELAPVV